MVHAGQINETATLCKTIEEECRNSTSEDHDLSYTKSILSGPEETPVDNK